MSERNEEYYALKGRLDKWSIWILLIYPFFGLFVLVFGSAWLGYKLLQGPWGILGFFIGGFLWQVIGIYLCKKTFGFVMYSKEECQKCHIAMARWNGAWVSQDYMCRECGNNNSLNYTP